MAEIKVKISAEIEHIATILAELKKISALSEVSTIELAGIGALLHNFYNCIENIIKQILLFKGLAVPTGSFWHRDLLESACSSQIISSDLKMKLAPYLAFRHFFVHGYSLDLKAEFIFPLVQNTSTVFEGFSKELRKQVDWD
jgi:uncharacterized protein YutE (UPF0331/DUF86 family)